MKTWEDFAGISPTTPVVEQSAEGKMDPNRY